MDDTDTERVVGVQPEVTLQDFAEKIGTITVEDDTEDTASVVTTSEYGSFKPEDYVSDDVDLSKIFQDEPGFTVVSRHKTSETSSVGQQQTKAHASKPKSKASSSKSESRPHPHKPRYVTSSSGSKHSAEWSGVDIGYKSIPALQPGYQAEPHSLPERPAKPQTDVRSFSVKDLMTKKGTTYWSQGAKSFSEAFAAQIANEKKWAQRTRQMGLGDDHFPGLPPASADVL